MQSCINKYGQTNVCLASLQRKQLIGLGHLYEEVYISDDGKQNSSTESQMNHGMTHQKIITPEKTSEHIQHTAEPVTIKLINGKIVYQGRRK